MSHILARTARVLLVWSPPEDMPAGGSYDVYSDGQTGTIDYSRSINPQPIPAFKDLVGAPGSNGPGYGLGRYGLGGYGFGIIGLLFVAGPLLDGDWKFAVLSRDGAGNAQSPAIDLVEISVSGIPSPASDLRATSYSAAGGGTLTLTWTMSPDDN